jgi:hypothetical protein
MTELLDQIEITLGNDLNHFVIYIDVLDTSLSRKWLTALNDVLLNKLHLEKNYCFLGFADNIRNGPYLLGQINESIGRLKTVGFDYPMSLLSYDVVSDPTLEHLHSHFNLLHRYFEDLQGTAGNLSPFYLQANPEARWHIRQLNLLCHEFESWALSWRKQREAPEWQRPSQLMCWLNSPRYELTAEDLELFGIDTINRRLGGVYVGVNKAVGKHHYEVFCDEGRDSRIGELTTTGLRAQTLAAADFDIEWARDPGAYHWQIQQLKEFRTWLTANGFDPEDKTLTIGHPKVAQVDLQRSFGTEDYRAIWARLNTHLDVLAVRTSTASTEYSYHWSDPDYMQQQIKELSQ